MSIVWMDGFDTYATIADSLKKGYSGTVSGSVITGRFTGSQAFQQGNTFGGATPQAFPVPSGNTFSVGLAFRVSNLSSSSTGAALLGFLGASGATAVCKLGVDVNGALHFGRGDFTTNDICNSANGVIAVNVWNYIEVELTRNGSTGAVDVFVNGASVASASGVNTGAIAIDTIGLATDAVTAGFRDFDDLYVIDVATRLGECRIDVLRPSADTAQKDFTPSSGATNFSRVNEAQWDGDTTYVSAAVAGNYDLYDVGNLATVPATIFAVQTLLGARKDDATTRQVRAKLKSGSTTTNGTTRNMATSYEFQTDLYELNPDTAAAWTATTVNAIQLGVEVVT